MILAGAHPDAVSIYRRPYETMVDYLDELDVGGVPEIRRVLGALGPWARDPMPWFRQLARALI
jgi:hypothetical protein